MVKTAIDNRYATVNTPALFSLAHREAIRPITFFGGFMLMPRLVAGMFCVATMIAGAGVVSGQIYPNKPIRMVTVAPGGSADFAARLLAQALSAGLGQ